MAVEDRKATAISNRDAEPPVLTDAIVAGSRLIETPGTIEVVSGDSVGSTYRLASVASNVRVSELKVYSDDIGTTTAADIGIYDSTAEGGAVVDADFFASALSLNGGPLNGTDVTFEADVYTVADIEKPLWEALGLSEDPHVVYDIVATLTGAADAGGTLSLVARYAR